MRNKVLNMSKIRTFTAIISTCIIMLLDGCSIDRFDSGRYFENEEEAKKVMLEQLEEKYDKTFTLTDECSYKYEDSEACYVFRTKFQDEDGLEADAILPQTKSMIQRMKDSGGHLASTKKDDTYSKYHELYNRKNRISAHLMRAFPDMKSRDHNEMLQKLKSHYLDFIHTIKNKRG